MTFDDEPLRSFDDAERPRRKSMRPASRKRRRRERAAAAEQEVVDEIARREAAVEARKAAAEENQRLERRRLRKELRQRRHDRLDELRQLKRDPCAPVGPGTAASVQQDAVDPSGHTFSPSIKKGIPSMTRISDGVQMRLPRLPPRISCTVLLLTTVSPLAMSKSSRDSCGLHVEALRAESQMLSSVLA